MPDAVDGRTKRKAFSKKVIAIGTCRAEYPRMAHKAAGQYPRERGKNTSEGTA